MTPAEMKLVQQAEAERMKLKQLLDRGGRDEQVAPVLGAVSRAFDAAYAAVTRRLKGSES